MVKKFFKLNVLFISIIFSQEVVTTDSLKTNQSQLIELENQIKDKDKLISVLKSDIDKERSLIKDLTSRIGEVELENSDLSKIIEVFKKNEEIAKKNEIDYEQKSKDLLNQIEQQALKEQELKNKENLLNKNQKELSSKLEEVRVLEESLSLQKQDIEEKQSAIDTKYSDARTKQLKDMYVLYILLASIIATAFLSALLRQVYLWRKKIDGNSIMLPEQVNDSFENSRRDISLLIKKIGELSNISSESTKVNSKYFTDINDALNPLKDTIASQRDEIKRLQSGYDNKIKKRFVSRLIDLRNRVVFYTSKENGFSNDVLDATNNILKIVDYMFKTEGIESLTIESSASLENIDADQFEILEENAVETADKKLVGTVKDTLSPCYFLNGEDNNKEVIKKGIIEFYKLKGSWLWVI